jgi:small subunit ribosomal protein S1
LLVDVGTRGFLPASLISNRFVSDLKPYIGKAIKVKITEIDPAKNRLILSHKELIEEEREQAFENVASQLVVGDVVEGRVSRLTNFGSFVDIGGVDGLVHISEISYKHVDKPSDVLTVGQKVKVKVLNIDPSKRRISLSIKQADPENASSSNDRPRARRSSNNDAFARKYMNNDDNGFSLGDMIGDQLKNR